MKDDFLDFSRNLRVDRAECRRISNKAGVHHRVNIRSLEGNLAGQHFIEDGAEAVDVGALIAALSFDLFGRHVIGRAHGRRKPAESDPPHRFGFRDAEIHDSE